MGDRILRAGCRGRDVLALQRELAAIGYSGGVDGVYGLITEAAVEDFQRQWRLRSDGAAGPATIGRLRAIGAGRGVRIYRARSSQSLEKAAERLGLRPDALRRQIGRLPNGIPAGAVFALPARLLLTIRGERAPAGIRSSGCLGPVLSFTAENGREEGESGRLEDCLPVIAADEETWRAWLARRANPAARIEEAIRRGAWPRWALDLPPFAWQRRGRLLHLLGELRQGMNAELWLILHWPARGEPPVHPSDLGRLGANVILDPGPAVFDLRRTAQIIRQAALGIDYRRILPVFKAGGILRRRGADDLILSTLDARGAARANRARLAWDGMKQAYLASWPEEGGRCQLSLLEERGLRARARLADRLDCGGIVLAGLDASVAAGSGPWPGEFVVLDNFGAASHIH